MFAANEPVPKCGGVEPDALQDIQAGRSSTRWFGAGGGALWAAAPHSMVRWEERRGTAGGPGPAVLEPSASTMTPAKGKGDGVGRPAGPAAPGGSTAGERGQFPPVFSRGNATCAQTPPASPLPEGVELSSPLGLWRRTPPRRERRGGRGYAGSRWGGALPACFPALPLSSAAPEPLPALWRRCAPGVWAAGTPGTGLAGSPERLRL